jgi:hypothetical protein
VLVDLGFDAGKNLVPDAGAHVPHLSACPGA